MERIGSNDKTITEDNSEISSACDDCQSEISEPINSQMPKHQKREIHPISYGTDWTPRPNFVPGREYSKAPGRKTSMQSLRTTLAKAGMIDSIDYPREDVNKCSPRQLRNRRGCHTVIPSYSSDKSSGC